MERLIKIKEKESGLVLGLMSGTSLDGLDIALVRLTGAGLSVQIRLEAFQTYDMPIDLKERIQSVFGLGNSQEICKLNQDLGAYNGDCCNLFLKDYGFTQSEIDLIGSHGQTIYHVHGHSSLQISEAETLAYKTNTPVISNFRASDIAVGGSGAPLVPYLDQVLYGDMSENRVLLNLGGIANFTLLIGGDTECAFDTGPCNGILNELAEVISNGKQNYDKDGNLAKQGKVIVSLVNRWLEHPYFQQPAPKSTGREKFGKEWVAAAIADFPEHTLLDILRSATSFVAKSIALNIDKCSGGKGAVWASGGGIHNPVLWGDLQKLLGTRLSVLPVVGEVTADAKEAVAFALFAWEKIKGNPTNLPQVTGANKLVSMGQISLP
ncbi:MAG: anhydro-N-acetylmuramic acid kinase [SAR324 cluster bacterium]|nr:anhydro-N-acetylmuramic acid kinase [SAR324 cluster bacterium]